jgi:hypothetical protein
MSGATISICHESDGADLPSFDRIKIGTAFCHLGRIERPGA